MGSHPIKFVLGLGFAGILALMILISAISLTQMENWTQEMQNVLNETNEKISAAHTMRDSIRLRGDTLHKMYLTDDFIARDELRIEMGIHALAYKDARDRLYSYPMTAREASLLDELMSQTRTAKTENDRSADILLSDADYDTVIDQLRRADQARAEMLDGLSLLVQLQEKIANEKISDARNYQQGLVSIIYSLCMIAIMIAIYIAQKVVRETSRKSSEIQYHATHDSLTRLPNRMDFNRQLGHACFTARENGQHHVLCYLDLDRFKAVNDSCGHKAGDKLLVTLSGMVAEHIRSHDTLARLGGDEFGLLLEDCSLQKAIEITEGIVSLIRNYEFNWDGAVFHVGVSIGVVPIIGKTVNAETALNDADTACYVAKDLGRNQVHIHGRKDSSSQKMQNELNWVSEIEQDGERFSLFLQEIMPVEPDPATQMYEVLLRLNDDEGRLVAPGSYLPAAERFSLMKNVDFWVIRKTFAFLARHQQDSSGAPSPRLQLFINISINSLTDPDFTEYVIRQYLHYNIAHDSICFEIDESRAAKNSRQLANVIEALRPYSIRFSLDEFGEGVPSIRHLKELPVDYIKISGKVVRNVTRSITDRAMVAAICEAGKVMNIRTIAKHVENAFVMNQLKETGVDYLQGYHVSKPRSLAECFADTEEISSSVKQGSS